MLGFRPLREDTLMANYLYQVHHGHIVINLGGRPCLLDSGAPFSVGYEPIDIAGRSFPVEACYMGITPSYLSEHVGLPIEGMIGADIIREFTLCVYATERMVQFSQEPAMGDTVIPLQESSGIPIVNIMVNGRVRRMFLDTGAPTSLIVPEALHGLEPIGRHEDFYPLMGNFLTNIYAIDAVFGSECRIFCFGEVPDELRPMLEAAGVHGMIGSELLRHFGVNLSLSEKVMRLESPHSLMGLAAG